MIDIEKTEDLMDEEAVLTVEEIEKILRISRNKSYELANGGEFPIRKIGRAIRVPKKSFYEWLNANN